ncbi:prepilin-type N-terminal cleavage/methylation domain-containing protein [Granulicatella balaenopterae]|uniref:Prepilin-type N-terminal cleavage/methylation domain-containing protein n=1 Tax=Granulicatella balaenopterae TaxID=137733 RepID=A0A1H9KQ93_9LACT|nr:prepilin-type N-terminal cleavage/methylation domain-containing protein [Granulicatella balaenopterae]SER01324.1 prepilin-type N-terminal cleavage/methylation domain-containing protein [Granulicatella balaenopterae]
MFKKLKEQKGFTLAELLVVVAIIGVLVAISIPIFSGQLEKSRDAVTVANLRSAYAEAQVAYMTETTSGNATYTDKSSTSTAGEATVAVTNVIAKGKKDDDFSGLVTDLPFADKQSGFDAMDNAPGKYTVTFTYGSNGEISSIAVE